MGIYTVHDKIFEVVNFCNLLGSLENFHGFIKIRQLLHIEITVVGKLSRFIENLHKLSPSKVS